VRPWDVDADARRYLDVAAPLHHQDEELPVFPLVLAHGVEPGLRALDALVQRYAKHWPPRSCMPIRR
jgi:hypothetical protein